MIRVQSGQSVGHCVGIDGAAVKKKKGSGSLVLSEFFIPCTLIFFLLLKCLYSV